MLLHNILIHQSALDKLCHFEKHSWANSSISDISNVLFQTIGWTNM